MEMLYRKISKTLPTEADVVELKDEKIALKTDK